MNTLSMRKGFTLIELLIVIAIIAILATAVILLLNPAALLAQARDSQRISDLDTVRSAIALYTSTVSNPAMAAGGFTCGTNWGVSTSVASPTKRVAASSATASNAGITTVVGAGWVPIDFSQIPGGSPLSVLPRDPANTAALNYQYTCDNVNKTFEVNADMESVRYGQGGPDDAESTDGGNLNTAREVGNDPGLDI